jgi:hypothetical protein
MPRNPLHDFWMNITHAFGGMPPFAVPNGPRLTDGLIEKKFRLSRHTAEGFQEVAFSFLSPGELAELKEAVRSVREVASELGSRVVATTGEKARALPHFQKIVRMLAPDRFADPEAFKLGTIIEQKLTLRPPHLDHLRFMSGLDSTDDPALWVWAFVKESGEHDEQAFFQGVDEVKPVLEPMLREVAPEGRVYLRFRSTLDQPVAEEVAA